MKNYTMNSHKITKYILQSISKPPKSFKIPENIDSNLFLQVAADNKLFLAVIEKLNKKNISNDVIRKYHYHETIAENSIILIDNIINNCLKNELPLLTIKSFLPFSFIDTNIDIVAVDLKNFKTYKNIIENLSYKRMRNLADLREPDKEMYSMTKEKSSFYPLYPKLHLHRRISWNGITYINLNNVWNRHQYRYVLHHNIAIPVPSPEDELLIIAAHALFENKYITLCDMAHLNWILNQDLNWDYAMRAAKEYNWVEGFLKYISTVMLLLKNLGFIFYFEPKLPLPMKTSTDNFPILLPPANTLNITLSKMFKDLINKEINKIPRELFSYIFVETIWMYYKAFKKKKIF